MNLINRVVRVNIQKPLTSSFTQMLRNKLEIIQFFRLKALAVFIDSTGGSVVQAKQIKYILNQFAKQHNIPILCFAGAQVYNSANIIFTSGQKSIAANNSQIGDFTFAGAFWNVSELIKENDIKVINLSHGKYKDRLNALQPLKEQDLEWLQDILRNKEKVLKEEVINNLQRKYINQAEQEDCIKNIFDQPVLSGIEAKKYRLVDEIGTIDEYLDDKYKKIRIIELFKPQEYNVQEEMLEKLS